MFYLEQYPWKGSGSKILIKNRLVYNHESLVFEQECRYDMILGVDLLAKVGMNFDYKTLEV